jgi:hypothetical protein
MLIYSQSMDAMAEKQQVKRYKGFVGKEKMDVSKAFSQKSFGHCH